MRASGSKVNLSSREDSSTLMATSTKVVGLMARITVLGSISTPMMVLFSQATGMKILSLAREKSCGRTGHHTRVSMSTEKSMGTVCSDGLMAQSTRVSLMITIYTGTDGIGGQTEDRIKVHGILI